MVVYRSALLENVQDNKRKLLKNLNFPKCDEMSTVYSDTFRVVAVVTSYPYLRLRICTGSLNG